MDKPHLLRQVKARDIKPGTITLMAWPDERRIEFLEIADVTPDGGARIVLHNERASFVCYPDEPIIICAP